MKWSKVLFFASLAAAAPLVKPRHDQTVVGTIFSSLNTLQSTTKSNVDQINKSVASVKDNIEVAAQVTAAIKANYEAILKALKDSTDQITKQTTGAAGGIAGQVQNLGQQEIDNLTDAIKVAQDVVSQIEATITVTASDLTPAVKAVVQAEIDNVKNAIAPFVKPIAVFAEAASKASAAIGVQIRGLQNAQTQFTKVLQNIAKSLGIPGLGSLPGIPGLAW